MDAVLGVEGRQGRLTRAGLLAVSRCAAAAVLLALVLAGCGTPPPMPTQADDTRSISEYQLGSGDRLRVIVFGEADLSGEFDVDGTGVVAFPLIGQVDAAGLTVRQFEMRVAEKLSDGYLMDPRVSAEVLNYRPFYIYGEVETPGEYPYTTGMTVVNAVAVAGGYTYRANTGTVYISRDEGGEVAYPVSPQVKISPGDVVRVPERYF